MNNIRKCLTVRCAQCQKRYSFFEGAKDKNCPECGHTEYIVVKAENIDFSLSQIILK